MKGILSLAVKIGVSGVILYFLFRNIGVSAIRSTAISVNPWAVVFAALLYIFTQGVSTYRWSLILRKDMDISYLNLLSIYFIGMFFNNFLPTVVGGDIVKGYFLYRKSGRGDVSTASIFMDRYSGFAALIAITAVAVIMGYPLIRGTGLPFLFALLIGGFAVLSLVLWVGPLHGWAMNIMAKVHFYGINKKIDTFYKILMGYKSRYGILVRIFICSLIVQGGVITGYYALGRGLGMDVGPGYFFLFIPLVTAVSMMPISLSGLGLREGAFIFLFTRVGATKAQALTLSLMWFSITAIVSLIGGIEYIRGGTPRGGAGGKGPAAPSSHQGGEGPETLEA
ncbi:MAG: flippase-like domain-containing protein [Deltaproteobacteria bacterium]|nr:flippase-like domain-containing protein [Deltaproteobacteria bacterium]